MAKIPCFLVVVALALHMTWAEYPEEFQKLDVNAFVSDDAHVVKILECLVSLGCSGTDRKITDSLLQAYESHCNDCSPEIESKVRKIAKVFVEQHNDSWTKVVQKYDPKLERIGAFKKFLEKGEKA